MNSRLFFSQSDPEQDSVLLCYDQLGSVLEHSVPSRFHASVSRSGAHSSKISYTPADIQDVVWQRWHQAKTLLPYHEWQEWIVNLQPWERIRRLNAWRNALKCHLTFISILYMLFWTCLELRQSEKWARFVQIVLGLKFAVSKTAL